MDILKEYVCYIGGELHIGEVPETLDAKGDQAIRQGLRNILGNRQNSHIGVVFGHIILQLVHGTDGDVANRGTDESGGEIKGGVDLEAYLMKIKVLQQGVAQMTGTDNNQAMTAVNTENMADLTAQLGDVVAISLLTELAETAQILPDLGGGDVHFRTQRVGGDTHYTTVIEIVQIAIVAGQTVDYCIGNFLFFHRALIILFLEKHAGNGWARKNEIIDIVSHFMTLVNFFNNLFWDFYENWYFTS